MLLLLLLLLLFFFILFSFEHILGPNQVPWEPPKPKARPGPAGPGPVARNWEDWWDWNAWNEHAAKRARASHPKRHIWAMFILGFFRSGILIEVFLGICRWFFSIVSKFGSTDVLFEWGSIGSILNLQR